jgi:hypothetical protein
MKKLILFGIVMILLVGITSSKMGEKTEEKISKENATKIENRFAHKKIDLGKVIDYKETATHIAISYDSGWRVITGKEKFDKLLTEETKK